MTLRQKLYLKLLFLFFVGGVSYMLLELIWRQRTHWSMGFLGGLCFVELGLINEILPWDAPLIKQGILGSILVTANELFCGLLVNRLLHWDVWDYSHMWGNFMGQICILFSFLWIFVSVLAIILDDYIRYKVFGEEQPRYKIYHYTWIPFKTKTT